MNALAVYKSGVGSRASCHESCHAKPCNGLWLSMKDHAELFSMESDSSVYVVYNRTAKYIKLKLIELEEKWASHTRRL